MNREISEPESSFSLRAGRGARRRPFVTRSSRSGLAAGALLIGPDSVFGSRLEQLARQPATECPRALEHAPGAALLIAAISCLGAFSNAGGLSAG